MKFELQTSSKETMATTNESSMTIQFNIGDSTLKFVMKPHLIGEIKTALLENRSSKYVHQLDLGCNTNKLRINDIYEMLDNMSDDEAYDFFNLEDKNQAEIETLRDIKSLFLNHQKQLNNQIVSDR